MSLTLWLYFVIYGEFDVFKPLKESLKHVTHSVVKTLYININAELQPTATELFVHVKKRRERRVLRRKRQIKADIVSHFLNSVCVGCTDCDASPVAGRQPARQCQVRRVR